MSALDDAFKSKLTKARTAARSLVTQANTAVTAGTPTNSSAKPLAAQALQKAKEAEALFTQAIVLAPIILQPVDGGVHLPPYPIEVEPAPVTPPPDPPPPSDAPLQVVIGAQYETPLRTIQVAQGSNLQDALNAALPGDELVLNGPSYTGNFVWPVKSGLTPVSIRPVSSIPTAGTRMTPGAATNVAKIISPNAGAALRMAAAAHSLRLMGLEFKYASNVTSASALIELGDGSSAQYLLSQIPFAIILDRVYVHGHSNLHAQRGVAMHCAEGAIIDSWISEWHHNGTDSQAVFGSNGPGPFKIVNSHLEAAGENVMFGGDDPRISGMLPGDIELRRNHFYKPPSWQGVWTNVKNLLELKLGNRVLAEANVFENSWGPVQAGAAIVVMGANQGGSAPWSQVKDLRLQYNIVKNCQRAIGLTSRYTGTPAVAGEDWYVGHILCQNVSERILQLSGDIQGLTIERITGMTPTETGNPILLAGTGARDIHILRSILGHRGYPIWRDQGTGGVSGLNEWAGAGNWEVDGNAFVGALAEATPSGNTRPSSKPAETSILGADLAEIATRTAGVVI